MKLHSILWILHHVTGREPKVVFDICNPDGLGLFFTMNIYFIVRTSYSKHIKTQYRLICFLLYLIKIYIIYNLFKIYIIIIT